MQMKEMHMLERPTTLLTTQHANINRDAKRRNQPYTMDDFYLYQLREDKNLPTEINGAAAKWLQERNMYPSWALFCFKELLKGAGTRVPTLVAFCHPEAIILGPQMAEDSVTGMVLACKEVSNCVLDMRSPCGREIRVQMPAVPDEVVAEEGVKLKLH